MTIATVIWITVIDLLVLFGLMVIFRRLITKGRLNENKFAIAACGYMSFTEVSIWLSAFITKPHFSSTIYLIPPVIYLLMVWLIGYPFTIHLTGTHNIFRANILHVNHDDFDLGLALLQSTSNICISLVP